MQVRKEDLARALYRTNRRYADRARRQRLSLGGARGRGALPAEGDRRDADPPEGPRREAGAAAAGGCRGRTVGGRGDREGDSRHAALHAGNQDGGAAKPAALGIQIETGGFLGGKMKKGLLFF